jgi:hypothetical protein
MYEVYKINQDDTLSHKEHLNNFEEVCAWLLNDHYYKYELVKIVNAQTGNFRDYKLTDDKWIPINRGGTN